MKAYREKAGEGYMTLSWGKRGRTWQGEGDRHKERPLF